MGWARDALFVLLGGVIGAAVVVLVLAVAGEPLERGADLAVAGARAAAEEALALPGRVESWAGWTYEPGAGAESGSAAHERRAAPPLTNGRRGREP